MRWTGKRAESRVRSRRTASSAPARCSAPGSAIAILTCLFVLLAPAGALAQDGNSFDGQLPPAQPTQTATQEPVDTDPSDDVTREMMFAISGGLLVLFLGAGSWISRDALRTLPADERNDPRRLREEGPHKHERQTKAKARATGPRPAAGPQGREGAPLERPRAARRPPSSSFGVRASDLKTRGRGRGRAGRRRRRHRTVRRRRRPAPARRSCPCRARR